METHQQRSLLYKHIGLASMIMNKSVNTYSIVKSPLVGFEPTTFRCHSVKPTNPHTTNLSSKIICWNIILAHFDPILAHCGAGPRRQSNYNVNPDLKMLRFVCWRLGDFHVTVYKILSYPVVLFQGPTKSVLSWPVAHHWSECYYWLLKISQNFCLSFHTKLCGKVKCQANGPTC